MVNDMVKVILFYALFLSNAYAQIAYHGDASYVIVDASDMLDHLARKQNFTDNRQYSDEWLFNNSAIELGLRSESQSSVNTQARVSIAESGTYWLFVRMGGREGGSFKVAIGEQMTTSIKSDGNFNWKSAGSMNLKKGEQSVLLTRLHGYPVFDVLVLTRDKNFKEEKILDYQYQGEVKLLKEYHTGRTSCAKFGDIDGDGKTDVIAIARDFSTTAYNFNGDSLWSYKAPQEGADLRIQHEAPGAVWDLDNDGFAEVLHWRFIDGKECLVVASGMTGKVKRKVEWPCLEKPHNYNNYRLAIAKLHPGYPKDIIVFTDPGNTKSVTAYSPELELLWQHNEKKLKDHLGHYPYPVDLDGDGIDEVVLSTLALNSKGKVIWDRFELFNDNHDHVDSYRFADINGDGKPEALAAMSDLGVVIFEGLSGRILWTHVAEHSQQIAVGNLLNVSNGPHIAVNARFYENWGTAQRRLLAEIHWFDKDGNYLSKWPAHPLQGNPDFVKGNWMGDGEDVLFWHRFRIMGDGKGKLYFPETVYHMFDFTGNGAEEVITRKGDWVRVYGAANAKLQTKPNREPDYLRNKVTNHTHY